MSAITPERVLLALEKVRDPELDESLPRLGFVAGVEVDAGDVTVRLRLPTFFCAPNFAYLMVADAREAVGRIDGVGEVLVDLEDHFASAQINDAVRDRSGFAGAFPDETSDELEELRSLFQRKALTARQGGLGDALLEAGATAAQVAATTLADVSRRPEVARCVELRRALGLPHEPGSPALVGGDGGAIEAGMLDRYLRVARLVRRSLEGNGGLCRGLLATRYGSLGEADAPARPEAVAA
jgi:metal-sulfur cluster biosynthetic enzyme